MSVSRNCFFMKSISACPADWQIFNSSCYRGFSSSRILSFSEAEVRYLSEYRISINSGAGAVPGWRRQGGTSLSPQSRTTGVHAGAGQSSGLVWSHEGSLSRCEEEEVEPPGQASHCFSFRRKNPGWDQAGSGLE